MDHDEPSTEALRHELEQSKRRIRELEIQVEGLLRTERKLNHANRERETQLRRIEALNDLPLRWDSRTTPDDVIYDVMSLLPVMFALDRVVLLTTASTATDLALSRTSFVVVDELSPELAVDRASLRQGECPSVLAAALGQSASPDSVVLLLPVQQQSRTTAVVAACSHGADPDVLVERPRPKHEPILRLLASHLGHGISQALLTRNLRTTNDQLVAAINKLESTQNQLLQTSKLEAVGRLAGGVAHDFNNLLTVILSYSSFALADAPDAASDLVQVVNAAERAAVLTNQLLAFSRQQERRLTDLNINQIVKELGGMLERVLGEDVQLRFDLGADLPLVHADRGQMDQILLNLVVNARDAISPGGSITIRTRLVNDFGRPNPQMVRLSVQDDGCGMEPEVVERIFEPFFTTKEVGEGTGMGLATVYGIVAQACGSIDVWSEPGLGSRFDVHYPVVEGAQQLVADSEEFRPFDGTETVLVVEDEPHIRTLVARTLRSGGYQVVTACDGNEALRLAEHTRIDLLVTDVIMPNRGGVSLAKALRSLMPGLPTLLMSGYPADRLEAVGLSTDSESYLPKPFTPAELLGRVRRILDRSTPTEVSEAS